MAIDATRCLCWRACHAVDLQEPGADELAIEAKVFGSETAVRVLTDLMRVVGIESYDQAFPLGRLLQDALALPVFWRRQHRRSTPAAACDPAAA
jgi:butyryl-CoA dehydrogenase